jgi:hypothetical protein
MDALPAENPLELTLQIAGVLTNSRNGVIKMEYLFVVIVLASFGLIFAGLKGTSETRKNNITRLEL